MKVGPRRPLAPDADVIRALAGLLSETGLSEIEYAVGDHRIRVARESAGKTVLVNGMPTGACNGGHANGAAHHSPAAEPDETAEAAAASGTGLRPDDPGLITAPLVGVAYLAAQPGAAPFVRVGDPDREGSDPADHRGDEGHEPDPRAARRPAAPASCRRTPTRSNTARR